MLPLITDPIIIQALIAFIFARWYLTRYYTDHMVISDLSYYQFLICMASLNIISMSL